MAHCADHSGLVEDLARSEAELAATGRESQRLAGEVAALGERVRGLELRIAAWSGGAALLGALLPRLMDVLTPAAHAAVELIGG